MGGGIDCAAAASSPAAWAGIPVLVGKGPASPERRWGNGVGGKVAALAALGCLLAAVPDSAADEGVPLRADAASSLCPGSIMAVGLRAQGAAVPTVGLGIGGPLLGRGAAVLAPVLVLGALVAWFAQGA